MNDQHRFVCHRMQAAQSTNQSGGRGYNFAVVPEEPKTPGFVWKFIAWAFGLTVFFVFTPVIVRALMQGS